MHSSRILQSRVFQWIYGLSVSTIAWLITSPALAQGAGSTPAFHPIDLLRHTLQWIESLGLAGGVAFIALYIVAAVAFLPGSILTLGAGAVFGVWLGVIYVFVGATLGSIAAFLVGRYLARGWISKKIEKNPNFAAIDQAVANEGFKIVLLTRLSPLFPFNLLNYAFGITGVSLKAYALGSIGMLPAIVLYVYIGSLAGDLARIGTEPTEPAMQWAMRLIGLMATVAVTVYVTRVAQKALAEKVDA
ncbi:DedA family protein, putative [uncultured Leptolyngbya sp.]|uniref:TVP38/TMEM64 family membrane protein n=1 Tax=uncultured Leptolyngbya sp. TaxID=332963 RepID=A0A6J4NLI1_9CYAN|nr:DedA family protein, putative [uncultured Leptolyngbya sp.]